MSKLLEENPPDLDKVYKAIVNKHRERWKKLESCDLHNFRMFVNNNNIRYRCNKCKEVVDMPFYSAYMQGVRHGIMSTKNKNTKNGDGNE